MGKKITQLPTATTPLSGDEITVLVQNGRDVQCPVSSIGTGGISGDYVSLPAFQAAVEGINQGMQVQFDAISLAIQNAIDGEENNVDFAINNLNDLVNVQFENQAENLVTAITNLSGNYVSIPDFQAYADAQNVQQQTAMDNVGNSIAIAIQGLQDNTDNAINSLNDLVNVQFGNLAEAITNVANTVPTGDYVEVPDFQAAIEGINQQAQTAMDNVGNSIAIAIQGLQDNTDGAINALNELVNVQFENQADNLITTIDNLSGDYLAIPDFQAYADAQNIQQQTANTNFGLALAGAIQQLQTTLIIPLIH